MLIQKIVLSQSLLKGIIFAGSGFPALFKRPKTGGKQDGCVYRIAGRRDLFFYLFLTSYYPTIAAVY